jgi:hypothetical protein
MHHRTEHPFVDEFRWVSPLHLVKNEWQNAVPLCRMLQVGPPSLQYCCAVVLRSSILLPPVGHSSNHEYHCCQLTGKSSSASNFYHNFKIFHLTLLRTEEHDRFTNFPFTVIILFVLFFLICDLLLAVVCVFQLVACICYSFCPGAVVSAHTNSK